MCVCVCVCVCVGGYRGSRPPLENHNWPKVSLEILVQTPLEHCFLRDIRTFLCGIH